ncbi:hypothetical protein Vadar_007020 [Vaccinium darrowii]|uniref:Uncharacterized protein n=1 Tax=Vaccinium darrowii TaxID=229202 RepID=A0ACB7YDI2_9ERIC|nr:hypothetical protein Vadar_007020 [Vaccinium darrowii]
MDEPRPKRPRITRGDDDYMPGNIVEIELNNFMTFNKLTCKPGPRLNLVVGPNGSGKSSLVCAIALGLGGEPQLLGRASSVGAFVKRGEESGFIKISLRGDTKEEHLTITRRIDTRNKSEWLFNGKLVPKKYVVEVIQRFNIQVSNLTQFLPQDRVCEFAKLTPTQLLEETEKAVGDPKLPVQHRALVDKSGELKKLERNIQRNGEYLNQLKLLNSEQERDVERVRQREELLEKAESMKKKLPWLKCDKKRAELMEAKEQENDARKKLDEAAKTLTDAREPIEKQKTAKAAEDAKCKKISCILDGNAKKRMHLMENEIFLGGQVRSKYNEMEELKRQEESRQQRILRAKDELISAEVELANLPPYEPPKNELEKLGAQIFELEEIAREKRHQKAENERLLSHNNGILRQCVDRLRDMDNTNNKLLHALRNAGAEKIFEAYRWVQEHRNEFNKEVYGPVLLEVKVSNRIHADYLEGHIAYYIWKSFITQDSGDRDTLVKNLGSLDFPVINHVGDGNRDEEPFHMRALGISSRLDQVFDAPVAVKDVLIGQFGLKNSYIGSKETDQRADEIQRLGIFDFWTPENHYRWSKSRYGGHVSALVEPVDHSRLLLCNQDVGELERLTSRKKELEETIMRINESSKYLHAELRHAEDEAAKLQRQREDIMSSARLEKRKQCELENRIDQRKKKLKSMEQEGDLDTVLAKLVDTAGRLNARRFGCAIEIKNLIIEAVADRRSFAERKIASIELEAKIREMEVNVKQQENFVQQASLHLKYCEKEVEDFKQQLSAAERHAESVAIRTTELELTFIEMPATIEELEVAIEDTIAQANSIFFLNHNILEEYESRRKKIEELSRKHEMDEKEFSAQLDEINELKKSWLPTLRSLVSQINETFSHNFQEMAVAGEVLLVKFRQVGQLQVLSAHHQSGGERSVSTILYLVSLQDLTNCPFRVVDEINQGMDPINERKMFQQLVRAASQSNTPQCFLLTPKLLPNLEYSEACSILTVMNGPWIEDSSKVWSSGECWGSVMGLLGSSNC